MLHSFHDPPTISANKDPGFSNHSCVTNTQDSAAIAMIPTKSANCINHTQAARGSLSLQAGLVAGL